MDPASCPWSSLTTASISFCEARLCSWVAEPSNTISNVAYLLPAIWVARQRQLPSGIRLMEAMAATVLAFTSGFFHATGSRIGELADVSSMYVLPSLSIGVLLADRGARALGVAMPFLVWAAATALMALTGSDGIVAWGTLAFASIAVESQRVKVLPEKGRFRDGVLVIVSFLIGYGIWWLDELGIACNPSNHVLTGHAIWHCFTAAAIYFFYRLHVRVAQARTALASASPAAPQ